MSNTNLYPTANNVALFLNGVHIDQAYQIQYRETSNKAPIYGYNDYTYSKISYGKQLIEGSLVVLFKFSGYLNVIIDALYDDKIAYVPALYNYGLNEKTYSQKQKLITNIQQELKTELPANSSKDNRAARAAYIASLLSKDKNTVEATRKALEREFIEPEPKQFSHLMSPLSVGSDGLLLDAYYTDPTFATWFVRFSNVHFYQVNQAVSQAGAEGSSEPLYEVYSWMAASRITKLIGDAS